MKGHADILHNGKAIEQQIQLKGSDNPSFGDFMRLMAGYVVPIKNNFAAVWFEKAGNHIKKGGLAGPIRTNQSQDFTFFNMKVQGVYGENTAKMLR